MKAATFIRFAQSRFFWRLRRLIERVRFEIVSRYFRARIWMSEKRQNSGLLMQFGYVIAGQILLALLITAAIWGLDSACNHFRFFVHWPKPDASNYVSFLGTVAQIGGVFIALYFAALTSVAATVFAKVPAPIRNLLIGERIGALYMRYLAFATFLPLLLIGLALGGVPPLHLAVPFIVLLAGMAVLLFVHLGQRAFNLFDPTNLAFGAFEQFRASWMETTPHGFRWLDRSFQNHHRRNATSIMTT